MFMSSLLVLEVWWKMGLSKVFSRALLGIAQCSPQSKVFRGLTVSSEMEWCRRGQMTLFLCLPPF